MGQKKRGGLVLIKMAEHRQKMLFKNTKLCSLLLQHITLQQQS